LAVASLVPAGVRAEDEPRSHDGKHVLVRFRGGTTAAKQRESHRRNKGAVESSVAPERIEVVKVGSGDTVEAAVGRYRSDPDVEFAEPNYVYSATDVLPNDTYFPGNGASTDLWGLQNTGQNSGTPDADIDAPEGWALTGLTAGSPWPSVDITVGIVDTGVWGAHPDLQGKLVFPCSNALRGTGTLADGCNDGNGHGTHVTGTVAALGNNGAGVVGVAFSTKVYMCKALSDSGSGYDIDVVACINELVSKRDAFNLRVISMSLGGGASSALQAAVDNAWNNGVLVVAAAGNSGSSRLEYPAGYASVVSVGATDRNDKKASFSQYNSDVEVSAPGVSVLSTVPPTGTYSSSSGYRSLSGTSMATPHAAGVAALIYWATGKTGTALRSALDAAVDDLGTAGRDTYFGYGRVNLCTALGGACTYSNVVPPTPTPAPTPAPGTLAGTAYRAGAVRSNVKVIVSGNGKSTTYTALDGTYTFSLQPGAYTAWAKYGRRTCRAGAPDGSKYAYPAITSATTTTVDWYC
jgi:thermitase